MMPSDQLITVKGKRILLGVTGGIAAYKIAELTRLLKKADADVRIMMTTSAQEFMTPLTFQALSGNPVHHSLLDPAAEAAMGHIELAKWADVIVIAPASANTIAKLTYGLADDLLTTVCLATTADIIVAPAMNQAMWHREATQHNIETLQTRKQYYILGPAQGEQACGDMGYGRMVEPADIYHTIEHTLIHQILTNKIKATLTGKHIVITAGSTQEAIDPVRYLSNHSSGKMGYALASAANYYGTNVTLISGPTRLTSPHGVNCIAVKSAEEMYSACMQSLHACDIFIGAAAVADFKPTHCADKKIKKQSATDVPTIELSQNPDIIATIAKQTNKPFIVGFAAETNDVIKHAQSKLQRKNIDMIIANDVSKTDRGFNSENNAATAIWQNGSHELALMPKTQLAHEILTLISQHQSFS